MRGALFGFFVDSTLNFLSTFWKSLIRLSWGFCEVVIGKFFHTNLPLAMALLPQTNIFRLLLCSMAPPHSADFYKEELCHGRNAFKNPPFVSFSLNANLKYRWKKKPIMKWHWSHIGNFKLFDHEFILNYTRYQVSQTCFAKDKCKFWSFRTLH